jgi:hypothetical protein
MSGASARRLLWVLRFDWVHFWRRTRHHLANVTHSLRMRSFFGAALEIGFSKKIVVPLIGIDFGGELNGRKGEGARDCHFGIGFVFGGTQPIRLVNATRS